MSYLWSDKITDYYYSNPELDTVAVLWTSPDDDTVREHYIKVDEADEQWRDFLKEVSYEDIDKRTQVRHEDFREQFRVAFRDYAANHEDDFTTDNNKSFENVIFNFLTVYDKDDPEQKEQIFKLKLKIFEQDIVKNAKKDDKFKNAKTFIRKAKTPMEVLLGYMVFSNNAELKLDKKKKNEVEGVYIPLK